MPDEFDLDSDDAQVLDPNIRREMRESRKRAAELEQQLSDARREAAFARAGVDETTPIGRMFVKGYEGETTPEAIKAAASEIPGLLPTPVDTSGLTQDEIEAHKRAAGASGGAGAGGPDLRTQFNSEVAALQSRFDRHDPTLTMDEVMSLVDQADPSLGIVRRGVQG